MHPDSRTTSEPLAYAGQLREESSAPGSYKGRTENAVRRGEAWRGAGSGAGWVAGRGAGRGVMWGAASGNEGQRAH